MKEPARFGRDAEEEREALRRCRECFGMEEKSGTRFPRINREIAKHDWKGVERRKVLKENYVPQSSSIHYSTIL